MIFYESTPYPTLLSHIVFVLILAELYRTLIVYLREHRVSVEGGIWEQMSELNPRVGWHLSR
jgi:uncharacterized membrane protein (DUF373 family)